MKEYSTKQFEFFRDEILGELGWCDEVEESGIDPLEYAVEEIRKMKKEINRLSGVSTARFQSRSIRATLPVIEEEENK